MKYAIKNLIVALGADRLVKWGYGGLGAILMFHRVQPACALSRLGAANRGDVTPEDFIQMLDFLLSEDIDIVSLDTALQRMRHPAAHRQFVCLTFDDGYLDNYETLWPILKQYRLPAVVYVTPGFIDRTAPMWWYALDALVAREDELTLRFSEGDFCTACFTPAEKEAAFEAVRDRLLVASEASRATAIASMVTRYGVDFEHMASAAAMTWEMVRELAGTGLVEIGAHTMTHPPLASLSGDDAFREIVASKERLEAETAVPVRHFAFPFGDGRTTGAREIDLATRAGFASATTTRQGAIFAAHARTPHALPRYTMGADDCHVSLRIKLSGLPVALRRPFRPTVLEPAC